MASLAMLPMLRAAGSFMQAYGAFEQGRAARIAGERARYAAEFQAWQADEQGKLAIAIAQRRAMEERRQTDIMASRALAVAAASGGGVSDPTIINMLAKAKGEGAYRAQVALYEGEAKARELRLSAAASRVSGAEAVVDGIRTETGYQLSGLGSLVRGGASLYQKYGNGGPSGDSDLIGGGLEEGYG